MEISCALCNVNDDELFVSFWQADWSFNKYLCVLCAVKSETIAFILTLSYFQLIDFERMRTQKNKICNAISEEINEDDLAQCMASRWTIRRMTGIPNTHLELVSMALSVDSVCAIFSVIRVFVGIECILWNFGGLPHSWASPTASNGMWDLGPCRITNKLKSLCQLIDHVFWNVFKVVD